MEQLKCLCLPQPGQPEELCHQLLINELLYFYLHLNLRFAHTKGFNYQQVQTLQEALHPHVLEVAILGYMDDRPQEKLASVSDKHYQEAERDYASAKGVYPEGDPLAVGESLYAKLARRVQKWLGQRINPEMTSKLQWPPLDRCAN